MGTRPVRSKHDPHRGAGALRRHDHVVDRAPVIETFAVAMSGVLSTATKKLAERPLAHVRFIEPLNELTAREILVRARVRRGAAGGEEQENAAPLVRPIPAV